MPDRIIAGTGALSGAATLEGNLEGNNTNTATITGTLDGEINLNGTVNLDDANMAGNMNYQGSLAGMNVTNGAASATLSIRMGQDGQDGRDGFSPTITVHKDTKTEYVLKITDINGSYLTPNLYPDIEGLQDVATLVAGKVDEDLKEYPVLKPTTLSANQRQETYLYVNAVGLNRKIQLSEIALEKETIDRIGTKLQTVDIVPERENWKIGDYILLDIIPQDNN